MAAFLQAFKLQIRVLWALSLREIHGQKGKSRLGYLWLLFNTGFVILVFWIIRARVGVADSVLPPPLFLLLGYVPYQMFSSIVFKTMEAVETNRSLLTFSPIFELDLILSSALVAWLTQAIVMVIYLGIFQLYGYSFTLHDPVTYFLTLVGVGIFGLAVGLVLSSISIYLPVIEKLTPMFMRFLFFTSGVFFSPAMIAMRYGSGIIMWNPLCSFIELARGVFITRTPSSHARTFYIIVLTGILLAVGLLWERYVRGKEKA